MSNKVIKIKKISTFIKWLLLIFTTTVVVYLFQQLLIEGQIRYYAGPVFDKLWQSDTANKTLLGLITLPVFILMLLSVYFIVKALNLFQKGIFYSSANFIGYFGFIWTKIVIIVYEIVILYVFTKMNTPVGEDLTLRIELEFGHITTLFFMLVLIYLLKVAKEVDDENKEFV